MYKLAILLLAATALASDNVIVKPLTWKVGLPQASLLIAVGHWCPPNLYTTIAAEIQSRMPLELWVSIPQFPDNSPIFPGNFSTIIPQAYAELVALGLSANAPRFIAGHSMGGYAMFSYAATLAASDYVALAVLSSGPDESISLASPALFTSGSLDRIVPTVRAAITYANRVGNNVLSLKYPTIVVPGGDHMAGWSTPTSGVKAYDIRIEMTDAHSAAALADVVSDFFIAVSPRSLIEDAEQAILSAANTVVRVRRTGEFLGPMENALALEPSARTGGYEGQTSILTKTILAPLVANLPARYSLSITDKVYYDTTKFDAATPAITSSCTPRSYYGCVVRATTFTEPYYPTAVAYTTTAATELRVKVPSRQAFARASYNTTAGAELDNNLCQQLNNAVLSWALANADETSLLRYFKVGEPIVMGTDIAVASVAAWETTLLSKTAVTTDGVTSLVVQSPGIVSNGVHYCKVISPATAMDWIYTNSLALKYGLNTL